jgi:hypothetical protein
MSARDIYKRFRGAEPTKHTRTGIRVGERWLTKREGLNILIPQGLAIMGRVNAIEYDCIFDGKRVKARHVFAPGSRPLLGVGEGRGEAFLLGDRYQFTDRGFVDLDGHLNPIDYNEKTGRIKPLED